MSDDFKKSRRERYKVRDDVGADNGSRTRLCSLGSCRSTDELTPQMKLLCYYNSPGGDLQGEKCRCTNESRPRCIR